MNTICRTLSRLLAPGRPRLLVSLPANDPQLARAAADNGAEGLKVHLNIRHAAAGVAFGSLAEEAPALEQIVACGLPVGVVPGDASAMISPEDLTLLAELGLDFMDVYLSAFPAWLAAQGMGMLGLMAAVGHEDMQHPLRLEGLAHCPAVQMVEASIIPHEGYGGPLSMADLSDYTALVGRMRESGKPVIVPTQRHIRPDEVSLLAATGIRGLLIGAIVTGAETATLAAATRAYREALEQETSGV
jgi:hypothetical protein